MQPADGSDEAHRIDIVQERKVYDSPYGALFDDIVEFLPEAHRGTYLRWCWTAPYSVAVLPLDGAGRFMLVESFRHAARRVFLEVPKGFGTRSQEPRVVAGRELVEEAGLDSDRLEHVGVVYADPAFTYLPFHLFVAHDCRPVEARPESSEVILRTRAYDVGRLAELIESGAIQDAVTLVLLQRFFMREVLNHEPRCNDLPDGARPPP